MKKLVRKDVLVMLAGILAVFHAMIALLNYFVEIPAARTADAVLGGITGVYAVLVFLVSRPRLRFSFRQCLPVVLLFCYAVSVIVMSVRYRTPWFWENNAQGLYDTAVLLLTVYSLGRCSGREGIHPVLRVVLQLCLLAWTAFMLFVLIRLPQSPVIRLPNRGMIAFQESRLYLNCHPNTTGVIAMTALLICCFMAFISKKRVTKGIYILFACVHYAVLVLSNSRTMLAASLIGFAGLTAVTAYSGFRGKYRLLLTAGTTIISIAVFWIARDWVFGVFRTASINSEVPAAQWESRDIVDGGFMTFNGRLTGFRYALTAMGDDLQCFLTGVTPPVVKLALYKASAGAWNMYTHNQFLEIGVAVGVPAMVCFAVWLFLLGMDCAGLCRKGGKRREVYISLILLAFTLANMLEATLLFYGYIISYVFFFMAGWINEIRGGEINDAEHLEKKPGNSSGSGSLPAVRLGRGGDAV